MPKPMKRRCQSCNKIFAHCECENPKWDLSWPSFEISRGNLQVIWDDYFECLVGDEPLLTELVDVLDGKEVVISHPGCMLKLEESNPYAVSYAAKVLAQCKLSESAPNWQDLIPSIPGRIY